MSDNVGAGSGVYFPPRVVDANGRRVHPGTVVSAEFRSQEYMAQIHGWSENGLVLLAVDNAGEDFLFIQHPSGVKKLDTNDSIQHDEFYVEVDGPTSVLIQGVGTRDLILRRDRGSDGQQNRLPEMGAFSESDISGTQSRVSIRQWSSEIFHILESLDENERNSVIRRELEAPILNRVLQEGVLPRMLERIVLLATDQENQHPQDTIHSAKILRWWLEAHHHVVGVGEPDTTRRWIREVVIESVSVLPHVVESVAYFCSQRLESWSHGAERIVVVHGGGTPAMNMGVLIASSQMRHLGLRHIQVPEPVSGVIQSLIEMDVYDMPEVGRALRS